VLLAPLGADGQHVGGVGEDGDPAHGVCFLWR
jgi:hypothetical protein